MILSRRLSGTALAVLLAVSLLSACAVQNTPNQQRPTPAPIVSSAQPPAPPSFAGEGVYVVQRGDSLSGVARKFGVPARAVIDANGLKPPFALQIGQRLTLPQQKSHTVEPGETLYGISRRYGVDTSTLVQLNRLEPPYAIRTGMVLTLPAPPVVEAALPVSAMPSGTPQRSGAVDVAALPSPATAVTPPPPPSSLQPALQAPTPPAVPLGGISAPPPAASPPLQQPAVLDPPTPAAPVPAGPVPAAPVLAAPPAPAPSPPTPTPALQAAAPPSAPAVQASNAAPPLVAPAPNTETAPQPQPQRVAVAPPRAPPPRAGKTFQWPVKGRVVATFGPQGGGLHSDGLNIAAPRGTPIRAAENGEVAYDGDNIKGLGNLLLIKHADGYMTAYAHAETLLVKKGDVVRRGQVIARVGDSGGVSEPQLHFEIRQGKDAIDPQPLMGTPGAS